jgi:predicted dehydrogenase
VKNAKGQEGTRIESDNNVVGLYSGATSRRADRSPLGVGVIGCGYWGPQLIRNFHEMPEATLVAVAEPRADRVAYVRRQYPGVTVYQDHHALLADERIDAVVLATPIHTHYALARDAILAGKHLLVEKPLAASVSDALDLIRLARTHRRVLMTGHTFLYNPAVEELRRVVASGELGRIYYVDAARLSLGLFQRHVNVIWDLAPHDLSILSYVLGQPARVVSARGSSCVQPNVCDVAYVEVQFEGGVRGQIHVSWLDPAKVRRITVVGDRKMAVYNDVSVAEKIRIYDKGVDCPPTDNFGEFQLSYRHGQITIPNIPWQEPLRLECEHFVQCVRDGGTPLTDGLQGLAVVAALEAASESLANGGMRMSVRTAADLVGDAAAGAVAMAAGESLANGGMRVPAGRTSADLLGEAAAAGATEEVVAALAAVGESLAGAADELVGALQAAGGSLGSIRLPGRTSTEPEGEAAAASATEEKEMPAERGRFLPNPAVS